jgi:formate hydrogenlyase subunit 3/multisubunit Na+/H+ antiporter MnhD subunit
LSATLLLLAWVAPLAAAAFALTRAGRWLQALAAVPALAAALAVPVGSHASIPWLLLGTRLGLDPTGRVFLLFTAVLWLAAGLQAALTMRDEARAGRFRVFYLLAMSGNFWLIVGQDLVSFYLGFSLMGLAAYGLVIHKGDAAALRAGRVYLVMTLLAEVALFVAALLIFRHADTLVPSREQLAGLGDLTIALLLLALAIKAGLVPLHVWLPLAHPAAPVPASAVLSGAMIKAALIGWMRFLPLGDPALTGWGILLVTAGSVSTLYAVAVGVLQTNPKVVLAYSSVGKMGLMSMLLGVALMAPPLAPLVGMALAFYAAHHGLAKGALFLGVGIRTEVGGAWVLPVLAVPALALIGAPFTSGALAKAMVEPELASLAGPWGDALPLVVTLSTIGTTLLMARFLMVVGAGRETGPPARPWTAVPWIGLILLVLALPWLAGGVLPPIADAWPVLAGLGVALAGICCPPRWARRLIGMVPPGDILESVVRLGSAGWEGLCAPMNWIARIVERSRRSLPGERGLSTAWPASLEDTLRAWPVAGALVLSLGAILLLALSLLRF